MSSGSPVLAEHHNTPKSNQKLKHDRDLPASSCSRFVTSYHPTLHCQGDLESMNRRKQQEVRSAPDSLHHSISNTTGLGFQKTKVKSR